MFLRDVKEIFLDFLFPKSSEVLALELLPISKLLELKEPENIEDRDVIAIFDYQDEVVKEIIWEIKYNGNTTLAKKIGIILYDVIVQELSERNINESVLLIPMPMSKRRRFERGWNQAELIATALLSQDHSHLFTYLPNALVKSRHTESQIKANKKERLENLHNSMEVISPLSVSGKFVILIDDVTTTGGTLTEAKRALAYAKARKVLCFAIAH